MGVIPGQRNPQLLLRCDANLPFRTPCIMQHKPQPEGTICSNSQPTKYRLGCCGISLRQTKFPLQLALAPYHRTQEQAESYINRIISTEQGGSCRATRVAQSDSTRHGRGPHLSSDPAACAGAPLRSWDTAPSPADMPPVLSKC